MYDYKTNTFGFEFSKNQEIRENKEKEKNDLHEHPIDESSWQTDNFPY
jgi:hypothetical protein